MSNKDTKAKERVLPILSSSHLAGENSLSLSEFEYALTMVNNAFQRWMQYCSKASDAHNLSPLDILVVHNIFHRNRAKRIADVAFTLNLDDTHNVSYSVRKLVKNEWLKYERVGKDTFYSVTEKGETFCLEYAKVREKCLIQSMEHMDIEDSLTEVAELMRTISGFYTQASRAASSL